MDEELLFLIFFGHFGGGGVGWGGEWTGSETLGIELTIPNLLLVHCYRRSIVGHLSYASYAMKNYF